MNLDAELRLLVHEHGYPAVALALARYAPAAPTFPARPHDPVTAQESALRHSSSDVRRFGAESRSGRLLAIFAASDGLTDQEATRALFGSDEVTSTRWEAARRRCSDLRRAGFIDATAYTTRNVDGAEATIWTVTPLGSSALDNLRRTGWSWPTLS